MRTIRSKVYVPYFYVQVKYKIILVYIKNKKGEVLTSEYQKEQTKTSGEGWDKRRK